MTLPADCSADYDLSVNPGPTWSKIFRFESGDPLAPMSVAEYNFTAALILAAGTPTGAWQETCREDVGGPRNSLRHHLECKREVLVTDDLTHQMQMRLTMRGGLAGFATCQSYDKRYMKARGH